MNYEIAPIVTVKDIVEKYNNTNPPEEIGDIRFLFWDTDFSNDSYKKLYLEEDEYNNNWKDIARNGVIRMLREIFPEYNYILVDVSW